MKTTMWDNESVRVNRLYVTLAQIRRKDLFMSITDNKIICDIYADKKKGYIGERKIYEFDENDLLVKVVEWEREDLEQENQIWDFLRGDKEEW